MTDDRTLNQLLERHRAFWTREPCDRPLLVVYPEKRWPVRPYPLRGGGVAVDFRRVEPDDIDIERLLGIGQPPPAIFQGDLFTGIGCVYPTSWLEAVAGCPIYVSAFGCVARPAAGSVAEALEKFSVAQSLASPWLALMERVQRAAVRWAGPDRPVTPPHVRGVLDILAAYLGEETLCRAVYDHPDELGVLADRIADLFIAVARRDQAIRPLWRGGTISAWRLYAPGPLIDYQMDASSLFSAGTYREFFQPHDRKALAAFPYSVTHLHAVGLHALDAVLEIDAIRAVQVSFDRETGHWDKAGALAACRKIQDHGRSLLAWGELSPAELREFRDALAPAGLAIECWQSSVVTAPATHRCEI